MCGSGSPPSAAHGAPRAEEALRGKPATDETFELARGIVSADCQPRQPTNAAPEDYKRHLAGELTVRALRDAAARAAGPSHRRSAPLSAPTLLRTREHTVTAVSDAMTITLTVNGREVSAHAEPRTLLVHFLRDTLGLTGTHWGCDTSNCGTCVVLLDGEPVKSCTVLAASVAGHGVETVEGLEKGGVLDPLQEGFMARARPAVRVLHPGMLMTSPGAAGPQPGPERRADPRGDQRPDLPLHRIRHHRPLRAVGRRTCTCKPTGATRMTTVDDTPDTAES